jgi:hypothetical protein
LAEKVAGHEQVIQNSPRKSSAKGRRASTTNPSPLQRRPVFFDNCDDRARHKNEAREIHSSESCSTNLQRTLRHPSEHFPNTQRHERQIQPHVFNDFRGHLPKSSDVCAGKQNCAVERELKALGARLSFKQKVLERRRKNTRQMIRSEFLKEECAEDSSGTERERKRAQRELSSKHQPDWKTAGIVEKKEGGIAREFSPEN